MIGLSSAEGRWTVAAAVLSSGAVFIETTVVPVALPALSRDLGLGLGGLQWVLNGYLLTLSALMLIGGSLGDLHGYRRVLMAGLGGFTLTSGAAALAPSGGFLILIRLLQGVAGAILVPNTLALLNSTIHPDDRGTAIGRWSAWSAVSAAIGPLVGGGLVDALSWRWVFALPLPFALIALWITGARLSAEPLPAARRSGRQVDLLGAALVTLGLAGVTAGLIERPLMASAGLSGLALLGVFLFHERRARDPMLPLSLFRSRQFSGANAVTLLIYAALAGLFFLLQLELQDVLGYRALAAGAPPAGQPAHVAGVAAGGPTGPTLWPSLAHRRRRAARCRGYAAAVAAPSRRRVRRGRAARGPGVWARAEPPGRAAHGGGTGRGAR